MLPSEMPLFNPTFVFGILVLAYLSSFILFAILRIVTGISIQRIGYFSLRRLAYTPRDGFKIEIRGLGLNIHRPTFSQPTWLSIVISELVVTVDVRELDGKKVDDVSEDGTGDQSGGPGVPRDPPPQIPKLRRNGVSTARSETWKQLTKLKERVKRLHRKVGWLRMVDVVATNSSINVVDVGNVQCGGFTLAVDTRRHMADRARFFFQFRTDRQKRQRQAEWIITVRSVLFTAEGGESLEVIDAATLNVHGFLYETLDGLRDATIALKFNRVHLPYDDLHICAKRFKRLKSARAAWRSSSETDNIPDIKVEAPVASTGLTEQDIMQTVSDSEEFFSSILRGIKEIQFAVSFVGLTKKVDAVNSGSAPILLNASMKEFGVDLHRLDPKSPAHRMYFPSKDIAHEALAAALSISIGLDDGHGKPERLFYVPMTTTTIKTTLPSKTVEMAQDGSAQDRNANIMYANSVITSPSVDLDPRHLPLLIAMLQPHHQGRKMPPKPGHQLISKLLPKANIKFTMHEPVVRITLPPVDKTAAADDFDLIISSISSISMDVESSHSALQELHYSLSSNMRLQSHHLYYQTSDGNRLDLIDSEAIDLKVQLSAAPDVHVVASGTIETLAVKMVRPEITDGLRQIIRQLRLNVEPKKRRATKAARKQNFLRAMPSWLLQFQLQATDVSLEVAGVDEDISEETRGVSLQFDSLSAEYRAQRLEGLQRRPSRRRTNSRTVAPDAELLRTPLSPRKKHQNLGDGRRVTFHVRGMEAFIVESADRVEPEPFVNVPRFEVALQALTDQQGPVFHIHTGIRSVLAQYSLYRHFCVGVAVLVLRKAFLRTDGDVKTSGSPGADVNSEAELLSPPGHSDASVPDGYDFAAVSTELVTVDLKTAFIQVKADMPHEPPMLLQVYGVEAGRHRWSAPFLMSRQIRVCVQPPRMHNVWARMLCIRGLRVDHRISRRKLPSGSIQEERMYDITSESARFAVPHEVVFNRITDNFTNVFKSVKQLHHRFKTGTDEYILDKRPEGPRNVPKISVRTKAFLFELEDGAFEWKLGMIYRAGRVEQMQRLAREGAFEIKVKKMREEEARRDTHKHRARSVFHRGRAKHGSSEARRHSTDGRGIASEEQGRGRKLRYDPDGGCHGLSGHSKIAEQEARKKLDAYHATSWKRRIDRQYAMSQNGMKDLRGMFWGSDHVPDDLDEAENILEVPQRPSLMSTIISNFHFQLDKPTFPIKDLPDFIHKVGKGMPKDMEYGLLVPMHVSMDMGEIRVTLRDYPLPLLHVPGLKVGQTQRSAALSLKTNFVVAEEFRGMESTRQVTVNIVPPRSPGPGAGKEGGFSIDVSRTIGPIKSFSDIHIDINTALPTRLTWGGPSYQPAMQDMMMVIESFTKPQVDPSERVGFWDKIRLNFHSRIHVAWKGDGDLHLALKGTRDPYCVTGNGAGFIMCWRNDIRWRINGDNEPKQFMIVDSGEYVLAIPDYSHQVREAHRRNEDDDTFLSEDSYKHGISFKKVVMKLSGKVQWMAGLVFERAIEDGKRSFDFKPHYDVILRAPLHAKAPKSLPYDAFRGFRSHHMHLSIAVRAPVDRDWMSDNPKPSRSYNAVHCTPRFFTHFFSWWSLFGGPMSLPIRQGPLWPGRERNSKKFGKHLATIKYSLLLAPLFMSHIYKHKDVEDYSENAVSATGLKVRFDSFMLDLHQRREEFNTRDRGRRTQGRTSSVKIHAAQLDLAAADFRAVSASIKGTTTEAIKTGTMANLSTDQAEHADPSRFTIPDNDLTWIDMDDFVELDWILPTEPNPDTKILPLAFAPRMTYFRQTDIGGAIAGDPDRTSPFGDEPTHFCIMTQDDDPRRVQQQLVQERLDQLEVQMDNHGRNIGEAELKVVRDDGKDPQLASDVEALRRQTGVLKVRREFLEKMIQQLGATSPTTGQERKRNDRDGSDISVDADQESMTIPSGAEFESDAQNRFVIHNLHFKWNNLLRNIVLRYIHQVSQRRGFVYYLSRPAVKFIIDIVEEQYRAKFNAKPTEGQAATSGTSPDPNSSHEYDAQKDIEERIKKILRDGKKFVNADSNAPNDCTPNVAMDDLTSGISDDFRARSNYHVRIIAPQLQFQSDKNKKNVVLLTAKGMELKVVEVMDKLRLSDPVSGLVQRRFLVTMDSTQFFVTHQKWFSTSLVSMYAGSQYGTPANSSWPPWVPTEVMFDFETDPFGFKRVVQKTSAMLRYDKYNTLRLKYNDEVNSEGANSSSQPNAESRVDNLWVEFPQARALLNSSQYYAMYVIVLDLLMYSEPLEKTRSERLEKIMLASDFSDLSGTPEMVEKLQERVRQLEDIKSHFQIYSKYLDQKGWEDRLHVERDLAACEDELFFMMKAITTSQRKFETNSQSNALLRWSIMAGDIVWHLLRDSNEPLVELQLKDLEYDRTDHSDGSHMNLLRVGKLLGLNLLPDAMYPEMIAPYMDGERASFNDVGDQEMIRVYWNMLEAIAGIPIMDHFEVNLFPLKIQLERELGKQLFEYIFPNMDGERAAGGRNDSPLMLRHGLEDEEEEDYSLSSSTGLLDVPGERDGFSTRPGSLELRLQPTLTSDLPAKSESSSKRSIAGNGGEGHTFRLFRSGATGKTALKKASYESLRSSTFSKPGNLPRSATSASLMRDSGQSGTSEKKTRFGLRMGGEKDEKEDKPSDDLTKMMMRASSYMTFAYINMPSVVLCLSYKGKDNRNFEDVHDFVFRMPVIEWRNKTWSNLDLALALKKAVIKALISHTGAIIGNKFKMRPNTAQASRLRELANHSSLIAPTPSGSSQHRAESMASDESSSMYDTSLVDFSRSPPRSLHGSSRSSIPGPGGSASRSSSVASSTRSFRRASTGGPGATSTGGAGNNSSPATRQQPSAPQVPSFLMMTPPTPQDTMSGEQPTPRQQMLLRPKTSGTLSPSSGGGSGSRRPGSSRGRTDAADRRRSAGGGGTGFLRDKLSALKDRMREGSSTSINSQREDEASEEASSASASNGQSSNGGAGAGASGSLSPNPSGNGTPESASRVGKRLSWAPNRAKTG